MGGSREQRFPTPVAAKLTGLSVDNLDKWYRTGFLVPSIADAPSRGVSRVYGFQDLVAIRVVRELREFGLSLNALRLVVEYLCAMEADRLDTSTLVTDGDGVFEVDGSASIAALQKRGQSMLLMVPIGKFVAELRAKARALQVAA